MRFMMIVKASQDSEAGKMPSAELIEKMGRYNEELVKAGVMLAGEGLHPTSNGFRVKFGGAKPTVTHGPFPLTSDLIAGFWIIQVASRDDALAWASRVPFEPGDELEVRQVFSAEDFAGVMSPEEMAKERALRDQLEKKR
jgi:hypothetical protein